MWRLAFVRPFEDPGFGADATGVMMKDADGSQTEFIAFVTAEEAIGHLNAIGYEPMSASIDSKTNRWAMFWRRAEYATPVEEDPTDDEDPPQEEESAPKTRGRKKAVQAAVAEPELEPDVIPDPEPEDVETPKKRGRPKKEAAPAKKKAGRPRKS
jgi:hypothetical protein